MYRLTTRPCLRPNNTQHGWGVPQTPNLIPINTKSFSAQLLALKILSFLYFINITFVLITETYLYCMGKSKQIKNNRITLRFINDLFDEIVEQARACNSSATVYLQNLIDRALRSNTPLTPVTRSNIDLDTYRAYLLWHQEFRKQGNNLNQIAKAINAANLDDRMVDPTNCLRVLSSIAQANQEIAAAIAKLEPKS